MTPDELFEPVTPLPYSRIEPWSLAPWLTGIIVALVIFVILIPALCSACYHYYSYKLGLDEDIEQEEYLEDDEDSEEEDDDEDDESCSEEEEEPPQTKTTAFKGRGDGLLLHHHGHKGSVITCCPRLFYPPPSGAVMPSCQLDPDLPRLPCGHFGVPTRDVAVQVPITVKENIYDDEGQSTTPSTTGGGEDESDTTLALTSNTVAHVPPHRSTTVTWKNMLSPSTESSSSNYNNERYQCHTGEELLIGGLRSTKCFRCGGYELPPRHMTMRPPPQPPKSCHYRGETTNMLAYFLSLIEELSPIPPLPEELLRPRRRFSFGPLHY